MSSESKNENDLKSPINGSPLLPKENGLFYSEHDDFLYMVKDTGEIIPIQSSISGSPLVPKGDGLFYSEHDDFLYMVKDTGEIIPIQSPISGAPLVLRGDGIFYCKQEKEFYILDDTGKIVPMNNEQGINDIMYIEEAINGIGIRSSEVNKETEEVKKKIKERQTKKPNERG